MTQVYKKHTLHCQEPWFSLLRSGRKRVEGRKNSQKYRLIRPGDFIEFYQGNERFQVRVTKVRRFTTLEEYLQAVTPEGALPGIANFDAAVQTYLQWNTRQEIAKDGFLAIYVSVVNE